MERTDPEPIGAYALALQRIQDGLRAGRWRIGERLPPERALAGELGVSRASTREALRVLEAMGVVRRAVGSGPDAGAIVIADPGTAITSTLRLHLATKHLPVADLVNTRVLIESWATRQAATRPDPDTSGQIARAGELLDAMDDPELSPARFHLLDAEFHLALTSAAGNALLVAIMSALRGAIHEYVMAAVPNLPDWEVTAGRLRREHRALLEAVRRGQGARAAGLVTEHIEGFYRAARLGRVRGDPDDESMTG